MGNKFKWNVISEIGIDPKTDIDGDVNKLNDIS